MTLVTDTYRIEGRVYCEMTNGKKDVTVSYNAELGMVSVLYKNAANKVYRGLGRNFWSWTEAKDAYKSADIRGMIEHAEQELTSTTLSIVG